MIGATVLLSLPMILDGVPPGHDDQFHIRWVHHFTTQFWQGDLYPRWLDDDYNGYGGPIFYFYPPLGYFVAAFLPPAPLIDIPADLRLVVAATVARGLAGWFCYLWLGRIVPWRFAVLGALVYVSLPYHLVVDLYLRTAYAELWAFVWLPLILYFSDRLTDRPRGASIGLALSYCALVLSHIGIALITPFVPVLYLVVMRGFAPSPLLAAAGGLALGVLLASVYLLPALLLRDEVTPTALISGELGYEQWFLGSDLLLRNQITFRSLLYQIGLLLICIGLAWSARRHLSSVASWRRVLATMAICLASLFMMTSLSRPLWELFGPLQFVQFPWRFATIMAVAVSGLVAILLHETLRLWRQVGFLTRAGLLAAVGWLVAGIGLDALWLARLWPDGSVGAARVAEATSDYPGPEWLPLEWIPRRSADDPERIIREPSSGEPEVAKGIGSVRITHRTGPSVAMQIRAETDVTVVYPKFYFPGAAVIVDGGAVQPADAYGPLGLTAFALPEGEHRVLFVRRKLREEWLGLAGSLGALILLPLGALDRRVLRRSGRGGYEAYVDTPAVLPALNAQRGPSRRSRRSPTRVFEHAARVQPATRPRPARRLVQGPLTAGRPWPWRYASRSHP